MKLLNKLSALSPKIKINLSTNFKLTPSFSNTRLSIVIILFIFLAERDWLVKNKEEKPQSYEVLSSLT